MIKSMTGFGRADGQVDGVVYSVEIRAVNNRYFKSRIKLPDCVAFLEEDIEKLLRQSLSRGMVNYVLALKNISDHSFFDIDEVTLKSYVQKVSEIISSLKIECPIEVGSMLTLPGIIQPSQPDKEEADRIREAVLLITREGIERLQQMRSAEGAAIVADLNDHCKVISKSLQQIRDRSSTVLEEHAKKLKKRVDLLLADENINLDEETLSREVAIFAERSDISEEIARLESHLKQFAECCEANHQGGRRLDFISQEMLREANTIGSKTSDIDTTHCVVDIKCRIDRIKEQVQNVE